ncbi:MAG: M28 family peptidase [Gemmatimonadaceae bacterium]|nr:M28 family peptidase [Gemmatimonadaceae bacterium]
MTSLTRSGANRSGAIRIAAVTGALALGAIATTPAAQPPAKAPAKPATAARTVPAAISRIREADLKRDLYAMAGDAMRGREAGTPDEMRASAWIADQMRAIGIAPIGDDGTYFQWFNMTRTRVSSASSLGVLGADTLKVWRDFIPLGNTGLDVEGPILWVSNAADTSVNVQGRVVATPVLTPNRASIRTTVNSEEVRYANAALTATQQRFARRGALAVILVADSITDAAFDALAILRSRGTYDVDRAAPRFAGQSERLAPLPPVRRITTAVNGTPPAFLVRRTRASAMQQGPTSQFQVRLEQFETPSTNIVGVIRGTDPVLRNEYVLYSSHQDHDGVRYVIGKDSVWAGADDNGTGSVALLAAARAFVQQKPKRSILFVYHGAEERGLLGSRYHAAHPVVPMANIVAVLNGEMIGRNNPDSATLLGIQPPHRNSLDLVNHALAANNLTAKFSLDSLWDRPTHPEGWYFRSDHVPYARLNVPSVMYTSNLHPDYHTPRDKPENIDYGKLTRMTRWMYLTGWFVANAPARPRVDAGFQLER